MTSISHDITVGMRLIDNDPRNKNRVVEIVRVEDSSIYYRAPATSSEGREIRVSISRIYTDGKKRTKGYSLVQA